MMGERVTLTQSRIKPTNQPTNQATKQASKQASNQASKQATNQPTNHASKQPNRSTYKSINQEQQIAKMSRFTPATNDIAPNSAFERQEKWTGDWKTIFRSCFFFGGG